MNSTLIGKIDDPRLKIESMAVLQRSSKKAEKGSPNVLTHMLYVGTADGCITQYAVTAEAAPSQIQPPATPLLEENASFALPFSPSSPVGAPTPPVRPLATPRQVSSKQSQKRGLEAGKNSVPYLAVDIRTKEPRLVALCDGKVIMLHCETLDRLPTFSNAKLDGATQICISTATEAPRLAAVIKRQVVCVEYNEVNCVPYVSQDGGNIALGEGVIGIAWTGNTLIVASRRSYSMYSVRTHQLLDQVVVDKTMLGPGLISMGDIVGCRAGTSVSLWGPRDSTFEGCPRISFSEDVATVAFAEPFYAGFTGRADGRILLKSTVDGAELVPQAMKDVAMWRCATAASDIIYAATSRDVYAFVPMSTDEVVRSYIQAGQLSRAVAHFEATYDGPAERYVQRARAVHFDCALEAFGAGRDADAFEHFGRSHCDAREVVTLFPELHRGFTPAGAGGGGPASGVHNKPGRAERRDAYQLLLSYLMGQRQRLQHTAPSGASFASAEETQQVIDYALLIMFARKAVDYDRGDLEALFLPSNALVPDECEPLLAGGDPEREELRLLLYATHSRVKDALELCRASQNVRGAVIPLRLGQNDPKLLNAHLPWMLLADPLAAIGALTVVPTAATPAAPVEAVMSLLSGCSGEVLRQYLRFALSELRVKDSALHTLHAQNLVKMVQALLPLAGTGRPTLDLPAGSETGLLGSLRGELLGFLATSPHYDADAVLASLEGSRLHEERAVVYSRNRDHTATLATYVYDLSSVETAISYCVAAHANGVSMVGGGLAAAVQQQLGSGAAAGATLRLENTMMSLNNAAFGRMTTSRVFDPAPTASLGQTLTATSTASAPPACTGSGAQQDAARYNDCFTVLLRVLLRPPGGQAPRMKDALDLLDTHSRVINPQSALQALPHDLPVASVAPYLRRVCQSLGHRRQVASVAAGCSRAEADAAQRQKIALQQRCVFVDEQRRCVVCQKKIGDVVFGVFPNLKVTHFRCIKEKDRDPDRGVPFRLE